MTSFDIIEEKFLRRVEEDPEFFHYYQVLESTAEEIIHERTIGYLTEGAEIIASQIDTADKPDFTNYDVTLGHFNFDLTKKEIGLLISLMFQVYLSRSIAKLKTWEVNWASADLRTFDPSNARNSFMTMYARVCRENKELIDEYKSRDRQSGALVGINYANYVSVDGGA